MVDGKFLTGRNQRNQNSRATEVGLQRFVGALKKDPEQPMHKWPVVAPLIVAVIATYLLYFVYGVCVANTQEGASPKPSARLTIQSCTPTWSLLGFRTHCEGAIVTEGGKTLNYETRFSRFGSADVGTTVPVSDSYEGFAGRVWKPVSTPPPVAAGQIALGPLFLIAVAFWYLFAARTVLRGGSMAARKARGARS